MKKRIVSSLCIASLAGAALLLSACAPEPSEPGESVSTSAAPSSSEQPHATPAPAPSLAPEGTAEDNLPFFLMVIKNVWASDDRDAIRSYVDALVEAGFDKKAMQITADHSTIGRPAETMQLSVLWNEECLIGQFGPDTGEPLARVLAPVEDGTCLMGDTEPISW